MPLIKRSYHPYWTWEEVEANMWGDVPNKEAAIKEAVWLMDDTERFSRQMVKVTKEWPFSCAQNLSNTTQNRVAWLGQAACALYLNCPASITKKAWWELSKSKRDAADEAAISAIMTWEETCQSKD